MCTDDKNIKTERLLISLLILLYLPCIKDAVRASSSSFMAMLLALSASCCCAL